MPTMQRLQAGPAGTRRRPMRGCVPLLMAALLAASPAAARNVIMPMSVSDLLATPQARQHLGDAITFRFGAQSTPRPVQTFGSREVRGKASDSGAGGEQAACTFAAIDALRRLGDDATSAGANAVINIESDFHNHPVSSPRMIECHMGSFSVVVVLRGELVRLPAR